MSVETELCGATEVKVKRGESRGAYLARLAETAYKLEENVWDSLSGPAQAWVNEAVKANDREEDPIDPPADGRQRATHHRLTNKEIEEITSGEEEEGTQEEEQPQRGGVEEDEYHSDEVETSEEDNTEMTTLSTDRGNTHRGVKRVPTKIKLPKEAAKLSMQERMAKARAARKPKAAVERPVARAERRPIERAARAAPAPRGRAKKAEKAGPTARVMVRQLVAKNPRITKEALLDRIRAAGYVAETRSIITWRYDVLQILRMLSEFGLLKKAL